MFIFFVLWTSRSIPLISLYWSKNKKDFYTEELFLINPQEVL